MNNRSNRKRRRDKLESETSKVDSAAIEESKVEEPRNEGFGSPSGATDSSSVTDQTMESSSADDLELQSVNRGLASDDTVGSSTTSEDNLPNGEDNQGKELRREIVSLQDELLRKQADYVNFRKRLNRDKEEAIKFANDSLLLDLTTVLDDFERAISAAAQTEDFATLHSGIELIEKQLLSILERKWGLIRFDSEGQPFDPECHEAIATEESADHSEAIVLEDYQKGYRLHGRIIRAARVRVATPIERFSNEEGQDDDTTDKDGMLEKGE